MGNRKQTGVIKISIFRGEKAHTVGDTVPLSCKSLSGPLFTYKIFDYVLILYVWCGYVVRCGLCNWCEFGGALCCGDGELYIYIFMIDDNYLFMFIWPYLYSDCLLPSQASRTLLLFVLLLLFLFFLPAIVTPLLLVGSIWSGNGHNGGSSVGVEPYLQVYCAESLYHSLCIFIKHKYRGEGGGGEGVSKRRGRRECKETL